MCIEVEIGIELDLIALVHAYRIKAAYVPCNCLPNVSVRLNLLMAGTTIHNIGFASILSIDCDNHFEAAVMKMSVCGI